MIVSVSGSTCDVFSLSFFFNDTATTEIYTLSLHDALPILRLRSPGASSASSLTRAARCSVVKLPTWTRASWRPDRKEHTSELQSPCNLVCRLLLEKKKHQAQDRVVRELHVDHRAQQAADLH